MTRSKYILTGLGAALGLWLVASSGHADAVSDLGKCRYDSRQKVIDCCQAVVKKHGKPPWMRASGASCSNSVVCVAASSKVAGAKAKKPLCYIRRREKQPEDRPHDTPHVPGTPQNPTHG